MLEVAVQHHRHQLTSCWVLRARMSMLLDCSWFNTLFKIVLPADASFELAPGLTFGHNSLSGCWWDLSVSYVWWDCGVHSNGACCMQCTSDLVPKDCPKPWEEMLQPWPWRVRLWLQCLGLWALLIMAHSFHGPWNFKLRNFMEFWRSWEMIVD